MRAAPAEADHADLVGGRILILEEGDRGDRVLHRLGPIELADHLPRPVLVLGRAAERGEEIGGERDEALERHAPGNVLDVRVEAAVLVDHYDPGERSGGVGRPDQVAGHLAASARKSHLLGGDPGVVGRDDRRLGVVVLEQRQSGGRGRRTAREHREAVHEHPAADPLVGVVVVQIDDLLTHRALPQVVTGRLAQGRHLKIAAGSRARHTGGASRARDPGEQQRDQ